MSILESVIGTRRSVRRADVAIDVGSKVVKAVGRTGGTVRVRAVPWDGLDLSAADDSDDPSTRTLGDVLEEIVVHLGLGRGATATCVPSLSYGSFRNLELPPGSEDEVAEMARCEFSTEDGESSFELAVWGSGTSSDLLSVGGWRLDHSVAERFVEAFDSVGLSCVRIDALPFVVARVVAEPSDDPIAVLDCGATSPTLTLVRRGRPCYVRVLRDCGQNRVVESLAEGLGLDVPEAASFVEHFAVGSDLTSPECLQLIDEYAATTAGRVAEEVERTMEYVSRRLPDLLTRRFVLIGGGGPVLVSGLRKALADSADSVTVADERGEARFAAVYSLSRGEVSS